MLLLEDCKPKKQDTVVSNCDSTGTISYSKQIMPIINTYCYTNSTGCHGANSTYGDFTTYAGLKIHLPNMVLRAVFQDDPTHYKPMPLGSAKLSACNLAKINDWIKQGYPNN